MGLCASQSAEEKAEKDRSKKLDAQAQREKTADQSVKKLLLLGAGESGKSTLFKQMITLYGKGYTEQDRLGFRNIVYNNTISAMKTLITEGRHLISEGCSECQPQSESLVALEFIDDMSPDAIIKDDVASNVHMLWADSGIQATFEKRAQFQLFDGAGYFFGRIKEIGAEDYIPTQQDVLRSRVRTTGIVETSFEIEGNGFKMFDVGGQRNERKKWIHCFENVTAVIFVAAISEYDQKLYEDDTQNRMVESLTLFDEICNSRWFRDTSMILFLNKRDLFEIKIRKVPLTVCFDDYDGPQEYEPACEFLKHQFESQNHSESKEIYTHVTCATDSDNIAHVFNAVKDIIIRQSLREGGLMDY